MRTKIQFLIVFAILISGCAPRSELPQAFIRLQVLFPMEIPLNLLMLTHQIKKQELFRLPLFQIFLGSLSRLKS